MKKFLFFILLLPFLAQAQITITGSPTMLTTGAYTCGPGTTPVYNFDGTYSLYTEGGNPVPYNGKPLYIKSVCSSGDCFVMYNNNGICGAGGTLFIRWNATWNYWELVLRVQTNVNYYEFVQITPLDAATPTPPCGTTSGVLTPFNQMVVSGASCTNYCTSYVTINGTTDICQGQSTTLTASGCSGLVTWSNGTTGNTVTVSSSGVIMASCNVEGVCPSSKTITINSDTPTPKLNSGNQTICNGGSFDLTASGCTGSLVWNNGATTSTISVTTNGTYSATCTLNGCSKTSTYARFTFAPTVTISGSNCFPTTLTASGQGNYPIQWMRSEEKIPGATNSTYSPTINGSYQVALISNDSKWTVTGAPNFSPPLDMYFTDADNGILLNQYNFLKTTDGGKNWSSISDNNNALKAFDFINATTGFAVGNGGVIMKTTNAGATWTNVTSPTTNNLQYIQFVDANNGFIMSNYKETLKTTNGGATWTIVSATDANLTNYGIYDMVFVNSSTGFATGKSNGGYLRVWKTTNAGTTWTETIATRTIPGYPKISMGSASTGWLYNGYGELLKTTDGGATWENKPFFETLSNARFINANQGWMLTTDNNSSKKKMYYTVDGGNTWTEENISAGTNTFNLNGDFFASPNAIFYSGTITYTFSGATYQAITIREKQVCISDTKTVISVSKPTISVSGSNTTVCSGTTVTLTANGCYANPAVWLNPATTANEITVTPTINTTYEVKCVESGCESTTTSVTLKVQSPPGITGGACLGTTLTATGFGSSPIQWLKDGTEIPGATNATYTPTQPGSYQVATYSVSGAWTPVTSPTSQTINSVYFVTADKGWIVGNNGIIFKTEDSGQTWTQQTSGTTSYLYGVYFTSASNGTIVGQNGKILRTTDGGSTWATMTTNTTNHLYDVFFLNASTGWAVGGKYSVLKTTNGGATWAVISTDSSANSGDYTAVQFVDANNGYVSGGNDDFTQAFVRKSTNGGTTWGASYTSTYPNGVRMNTLSFVNANAGWSGGVVSSAAPIGTKTTNGGTNWTGMSAISSTTSLSVKSMHFLDTNKGWTLLSDQSFGGYAIISTEDGGITGTAEPTINPTTQPRYIIGKKIFMLPDGKSGWVVGRNNYYFTGAILKFAPSKVCTSNTIVVNTTPTAPTLNLTGTQTLCPNTTINLIASGCSGTVKWSTNATGSTLIVSATGTYSAICTTSCGTSLASTQVVVTSIPASLTLTGSATDGLKQAGQTIVSTQTVAPTNNTSYKAGKSIVLDTSFQTQTGAIFVAEIGGCN